MASSSENLKEPEKELIARLLKQDEAAYRLVIRQHQSSMRALAVTIAGNIIADEVVQEAWLSMLRALPRFKMHSSLKTWLFRIVANEAKTRLRREKRSVSLEGLAHGRGGLDDRFSTDGHWSHIPTQWELDTPEAILSKDQLKECITVTIDSLPPLQSAVLQLKELENCTPGEICNILDISASNLRVLLHRARNCLFETIEHFQSTGECKPCA